MMKKKEKSTVRIIGDGSKTGLKNASKKLKILGGKSKKVIKNTFKP